MELIAFFGIGLAAGVVIGLVVLAVWFLVKKFRKS
ncbi:uncharacterized protein LOC111832065 [Capsella rubella]|nr:uncharacterized protein LOC111832065 [Capsella rubella]